jgi:adenylate kinase
MHDDGAVVAANPRSTYVKEAMDTNGHGPSAIELPGSLSDPSDCISRAGPPHLDIDLTGTRSERPFRVLLVGPPGAGKTTQGKRLAAELGVPRVSTGELLRDEVRRRSPIGREARKYMRAGELLPEWLVQFALERHLSRAFEVGAVFDGYPRTLDQAERFMRSLGFAPLQRVIELATSDDAVIERLAKRTSSSPRVEDGGAGDANDRADDDENTVRIRLRAYHAQTEPMLDFFRSAGLLVKVDGNAQPDEVAANLRHIALRDCAEA